MRPLQILVTSLVAASIVRPAIAGDVWHATRTLLPGDTVQAEDVAAGAATRPLPDAIPASRNIAGLEVKRRIYENRVLTTRDVGARSAVKASTPVDVIWKVGGLSLELDGRALEDGALGDEVRVLNPMSSRTIRGKVVGDGMVEIRSAP